MISLLSLIGPALGAGPFSCAKNRASPYSEPRILERKPKMTELAQQKCKPCEGGVKPLAEDAARRLLDSLDDGWVLSADGRSIAREFKFPGYGRTMAFVNAVAWIATVEGHHPDLRVGYSKCVVEYTTHAIGGLSDNDFICAAKIDRLMVDV